MDKNKHSQQLIEEKNLLEKELNEIAEMNEKTGDWFLKHELANTDDLELKQSENSTNALILSQLEARHKNIKVAIKNIEKGTFGICEVCNKKIEQSRLNVNPTSRTCQKHMEQNP